MSNLKLVPDAPTPLEKLLLDASRAELPSEDHKARLRAALGISAPLSGPFAAQAPAQAAPSPPAASLPPPAAVASKSSVAAKVAAGASALAVVGALWLMRAPESAPPPAPQGVVASKPAAAPVAPQPAPAPVAEVAPLPPVEARAALPRSRASAPVAASGSADLSEQIRLIEAARAGVASRDSKAALTALDSYASRFPRGSFGQEATVLRIRAVDQAGDSARATAMARSFVARFPNSPHVARLKPIAERGASR